MGTKVNELRLDSVFKVEDIYMPCVYFLFKSGEIVYVGQTITGLQRIFFHTADKDFDSVGIIKCDISKLNETETYYIAKYKPIYNKKLTNAQSPSNIKLRLFKQNIRVNLRVIKKWIIDNVPNFTTFNGNMYISEVESKRCIAYFLNTNKQH